MLPEIRASQAAYGLRKMTVTVFPRTCIDRMSSQPSRDVMSQFLFMIAWYVARKSLPVTWRPSLHLASALIVKRTVNGFALTSFGLPAKSCGTRMARWLYRWPLASTRFVTRLVVYALPGVIRLFRVAGSWSWPITTVPAAERLGFAVAAGPTTRLVITSAAAKSQTAFVRMYPLL